MQFRERRRVIQVIRTTYDPDLKRGRSEVVGKIDKAAPTVTDKFQKTCTSDELSEIATYLANRQNSLRNEAVRAGAETLPAQMRAAAEYFRTHRDGEAKVFAAEIRAAWDELKGALRKAGFSKSKVLKKGGEKGASVAVEKVDAKPQEKKLPEKKPQEKKAEEKTVAAPKAEVAPKAAPAKPAPVKKPVAKGAGVKKPAVSKRTAAAPVALAAQSPAPAVTVDAAAVEKPDPSSVS